MMSIRPSILLLFFGMALVTYLPRMLPLVVLSRFQFPPVLLKWLGFVPAAVLSALLTKSLLVTETGGLALPPEHLELVGAAAAVLAAIWTRSLMGTVVAGVLVMALLRLFF
jgi:branched-subunit amino acid transport protein